MFSWTLNVTDQIVSMRLTGSRGICQTILMGTCLHLSQTLPLQLRHVGSSAASRGIAAAAVAATVLLSAWRPAAAPRREEERGEEGQSHQSLITGHNTDAVKDGDPNLPFTSSSLSGSTVCSHLDCDLTWSRRERKREEKNI